MDTESTVELKPMLEGGEEAIQDVSRYFTSIGIRNSIALAPGCTPGT